MIRTTARTVALSLALLVGGATACTDLNLEPKSTPTDANVFNDPNTYRAFLARIYAGLAVSGQQGAAGQPDISGIDEGFSQYLRLYWEAQELPTDEAVIGWGDIGLPEMNTQGWSSSNSFAVAMYYRVFFQIGMANEFLRQTTPAALASRNVGASLAATIDTYRAEARFLRALSYWHGLDLFGSIPLIDENSPLGATPPQATRTQLFNFVESELLAALPDLPASGAANYGRATAGAAHMLLAKLYLNAAVYTGAGRYTDAVTQASAVIADPAFSLDNNYADMFLADNNTSPEIIFAVTQDGLKTQTWGGMTFIIHASCGGNMTPDSSGVDGCWWGLRLKKAAHDAFGAGDHRADGFFTNGQNTTVTAIGNFNDGIAFRKYRNLTSAGAPGSHPTHVDTDFPMFRLADAYLTYIEGHLRGGGGTAGTALGYFNALRQRAYGNSTANLAAFPATAAAALDTVLAERGRELIWEAHRRTDLVRYGRFTGGSYIWEWKGGVQAGTSTASTLDLYPIPASELIANPSLTQNPGY